MLLIRTDLTARVHTVVGKRVGRQRPLAVKEAHRHGQGEDSGAQTGGVGVVGSRSGAEFDGVEKVTDVDVDMLQGLFWKGEVLVREKKEVRERELRR